MGSLALNTNQPVHEILKGAESTGLAFVAFPMALGELPAAHIFSAVFFIALLLLGIDSAFSITEAALASMIDKTGWKRTSVLTGLSVVGFAVGILFTTRGGGNWLGLIDGTVNTGTFGIMFLGLIECLVLGWIFDIRKLRQHANKNSDWQLGVWWEWSIRIVIPCVLAALVIWSLWDQIHSEQGFIVGPEGNLIGTDIFNLALTIIVFPVPIILSLWRPKQTKKIVEFDT